MAKSARASQTKRNNQALKKRVFGPVEAARNDRLHAKLLELAKAPKEEVMKEASEEKEKLEKESAEQDMEVDETGSTKAPKSKREVARLRAARAERVEKNKRRKPRNQVTFPSRPRKRNVGKR